MTDYKSTVFLPRTDFAMRAELPKREPTLLARWEELNLYDRLRGDAKGRPKFVLHDGPPYANGNLHIGHALNKILKDIINRSQQMLGKDAVYVPGWDCHGLPIEWKIEERYRAAGKNKDEVPILDFRRECREFAAHWIEVQKAEFRRLGVEGDWENPYTTMSFDAEAQIARELHKFAMNGLLYRGSKPVMWSVVEKTALAEAEVEYHDHVSDQIWVKFPIEADRSVFSYTSVDFNKDQTGGDKLGFLSLNDFATASATKMESLRGASIVIWTTTPWTIPGNRAIALNEKLTYVVLDICIKPDNRHLPLAPHDLTENERQVADNMNVGHDRYADQLTKILRQKRSSVAFSGCDRFVVAKNLVNDFLNAAGGVDLVTRSGKPLLGNLQEAIVAEFSGSELAHVVCHHPLAGNGYDFSVPLLPGDHVTEDTGTGFVHTAPSHGRDDYEVWIKNSLRLAQLQIDRSIPYTVDENGAFTKDAPGFEGKRVLTETGEKGDANEAVIAALREAGMLVARGRLTHQYPHSWRSKKPVIFRNTPQWFIAMDRDIEGADGAATPGDTLRARALAAIRATRWVPAAGERRITGMIESRPDWVISRQRAWGVPIAVFANADGEVLKDLVVNDRIAAAFAAEGADAWFAPGAAQRFLGTAHSANEWHQVTDILDVWFDSGSTHSFVLEARPDLQWPASLYLEGSDQHRGWFHSSLLESCGTRGRAPYDAVLTHGFVLADTGDKMSKSRGNSTAPQDVIARSGAEILRIWVAASDYSEDLRIGTDILKFQEDMYRRLRNTLRYLLGNLDGFSDAERVTPADMPELERFVLHRLAELDVLVRRSCDAFDFHAMFTALHNFCAAELSSFYFDIRKDALYCDAPGALRRRACRTVLDELFRCLTAWLAPILVFTAEEAWLARNPGATESVHLRLFPEVPIGWRDDALAAKWERVREMRRVVTGALEKARAEKKIGSSLEAAPTLYIEGASGAEFAGIDWAEICITSQISLVDAAPPSDAETLPDVAGAGVVFARSDGDKCARCWRVLPEVGANATHPELCGRCADAVGSPVATAS